MRAVVQRVKSASVVVDGETVGAIDEGLMVLLGAKRDDGSTDVAYIVEKVANLRIFEDAEGKMNRSVLDIGGGVLVVSQFTLFGDARKGRRPSFIEAAPPEIASALYEDVVLGLKGAGVVRVETGRFRAKMDVALVNHGPVTILLDSTKTI